MREKEMAQNEQILIDRYCNGDQMAFSDLVGRHKKKIYYLAYDITGDHQEAEDISQEVFIKMFRSLKNFRRDAKVSSWLYKITFNTCIDSLRKRPSKLSGSLEEIDQLKILADPMVSKSLSFDPERDAEASQIQKRIAVSLQNISPKERAVFVMRHYNDLKLNEIAEIMNVKIGTVKSLLFRAVKKLQRELSPYLGKQAMEVPHE
jgi:RNA polymerase sigma-70 factor (ECF subfamily)